MPVGYSKLHIKMEIFVLFLFLCESHMAIYLCILTKHILKLLEMNFSVSTMTASQNDFYSLCSSTIFLPSQKVGAYALLLTDPYIMWYMEHKLKALPLYIYLHLQGIFDHLVVSLSNFSVEL